MDFDDQGLDPETEQELRDTMDEAQRNARNDGMLEMARYIRRNYAMFRSQGFSRKQAFTLTAVLYQVMLAKGA